VKYYGRKGVLIKGGAKRVFKSSYSKMRRAGAVAEAKAFIIFQGREEWEMSRMQTKTSFEGEGKRVNRLKEKRAERVGSGKGITKIQ